MKQETTAFFGGLLIVIIALVLLCGMVGGCLYIKPKYNVYSQTERGRADFQEAEYNRQIAELDAEAEVARAHGLAEANEIIGESLEGNPMYLTYLWIMNLPDAATVYVATEMGVPIMEANRFQRGFGFNPQLGN